ncbi:MAG: NUDIX hydrolase [Halorubrum sp.]
METTRHFTATAYIVNGGATALHAHERLGVRLPPGGHVERDELPHEAALREVREETGLEAELVATESSITGPNTRGIPEPAHLMLHDINVHENGSVGHQHVDHLYYARVDSREIAPDGDDEVDSDGWQWYTSAGLAESDLQRDVIDLGREAIAAVDGE